MSYVSYCAGPQKYLFCNQIMSEKTVFELEREVQDLLMKVNNVVDQNVLILKELSELTRSSGQFSNFINPASEQLSFLRELICVESASEESSEQEHRGGRESSAVQIIDSDEISQ